MRHPSPKQLAPLLRRLAARLEDDGDGFLRAAKSWSDARGYPASTSTMGGAAACNCPDEVDCPHGTATERAALNPPAVLDVAHERATGHMRSLFHAAAELENLMALCKPAQAVGRENNTETCERCGRVITRVGSDRPRMVDGEPCCPACYQKHLRDGGRAA